MFRSIGSPSWTTTIGSPSSTGRSERKHGDHRDQRE
jgi:hypothetical protein